MSYRPSEYCLVIKNKYKQLIVRHSTERYGSNETNISKLLNVYFINSITKAEQQNNSTL